MSHSSDLSETAKASMQNLGNQAKDAAQHAAVSHADHAKHVAADKIQQAANAADSAAHELDADTPQAQAVQQVADHIEAAAHSLRGTDLRDLATQVSNVARQNPVLFLGGAALLGFATARFLKAKDPEQSKGTAQKINGDPWSAASARTGGRHDA